MCTGKSRFNTVVNSNSADVLFSLDGASICVFEGNAAVSVSNVNCIMYSI